MSLMQAKPSGVSPAGVSGGLVDYDANELVTRCLEGDADAWARFVALHRGFVYSICYSMTASSRDAEDLVQDVLVRIHSRLSSFDVERGDLRGWITVLTRNQVVDHFRRSRMQRNSVSMDEGWDMPDEFVLADHLPDESPSPH